MSYEFEEAKEDQNNATVGIAGLLIGVAGLAIKSAYDKAANEKDYKQKQELRQLQSRYNDLDAKWFKSDAQKQEMRSIKAEINRIKNM